MRRRAVAGLVEESVREPERRRIAAEKRDVAPVGAARRRVARIGHLKALRRQAKLGTVDGTLLRTADHRRHLKPVAMGIGIKPLHESCVGGQGLQLRLARLELLALKAGDLRQHDLRRFANDRHRRLRLIYHRGHDERKRKRNHNGTHGGKAAARRARRHAAPRGRAIRLRAAMPIAAFAGEHGAHAINGTAARNHQRNRDEKHDIARIVMVKACRKLLGTCHADKRDGDDSHYIAHYGPLHGSAMSIANEPVDDMSIVPRRITSRPNPLRSTNAVELATRRR